MGRRKAADAKQTTQSKKRHLDADEINYSEDVFDRTRLLDPKTDICALCKQGNDFGKLLADKCKCPDDEEDPEVVAELTSANTVLDSDGVWASRYSLGTGKGKRMVHFYCALFSPQVWFNGHGWCNLNKEVGRGIQLKCSYCNKSGATLGCSDKRCKVNSHIPCAVERGYIVTRYKNEFLCEDHDPMNVKYQAAHPQTRYITPAQDLSRGNDRVPIPVDIKDVDGNAADMSIFASFEYCSDLIDSPELAMNLRSLENVQCCNCTGMCYDVNECTCLQGGKSYSFNGYLIPGVKSDIVECNFMCNCSVRRCTNRVVQNGLCFQLEIFPVVPTSGSKEVGSGWGVRTLEDIPANAFITIIAGQMVTANSIGKTVHKTSAEKTDGKTIFEHLISGQRTSHHKIIPLSMWEDDDFKSTLDWARAKAPSKSPNTNALGPAVTVSSTSSNSSSIDLTTSESDETASEEAVKSFLKGQICLDCRYFGNVGSFIRRRPYRSPPPKMLTRRLIYFNRNNKKYARLALFAIHNIPSGTELLI